jgi:hypothetical protein
MKLEIGKTYQIYFNSGNINNETIHVRAIVDEVYIVYRVWISNQKIWRYKMDRQSYFNYLIKDGFIKESKFEEN